MKVDQSLQEVFDWKETVYEETKNMTVKERNAYSRKNLETLRKKYSLILRKAKTPAKNACLKQNLK